MNDRQRVENILEKMADDVNTAKQSINIAVDFLTADTYWLTGTISVTDRERLIALADELKKGQIHE